MRSIPLLLLRLSFILLIITKVQTGSAQINLVPNPSFEDTVSCVGWDANELACLPWHHAGGTPDYLSGVWAAWCNLIFVPNNPVGYQYARTGNAYVGLMAFVGPSGINNREYIQCPLTTQLITGHKYYTQFYVSLANNETYACDRIGALFSNTAIDTDGYYLFNYIPQIENQPGNIITDTMNWTLISGSFYAMGGEQYITIGDFRDDSLNMIDSMPWGTDASAYYYIDDVTVIDCTTAGIAENTAVKFQLLKNPFSGNLQWISNERITHGFIFDITGKLILSREFKQNSSSYSMDVKDMRQGMYMIIVEDKNMRRGLRKFIKE